MVDTIAVTASTDYVITTAFYFLKAERNSMGTHFVYVVTFF